MRNVSKICLAILMQSTAALADGTTPAPGTNTTAPAPPDEGTMRLRNGFSFSAGEEFGSGPSSGFSGQLYGADWRIGMKINEDYAVYLQSHLSFGSGHIGGASGATGNFAGAIMAERSLPQRLFVAGGAGYGVLNNPSGPLAQARVGWYPMEHQGGVARRLNVALDARWYFAGDAIGTVTQLAMTIGYDRF
jgi:hypothetical protein